MRPPLYGSTLPREGRSEVRARPTDRGRCGAQAAPPRGAQRFLSRVSCSKGAVVSALALRSTRFSLMDLPLFLDIECRGDLSAMACSLVGSLSGSVPGPYAPRPERGPRRARRGPRRRSDRADVLRLRALLALGDVELDALRLVERLVAAPRDRREVAEHVGAAAVLLDEAEALLRVEPLHCALG